MSNKLQISIYSHEDEFIDLLYTDTREIDGQCINPHISENANGQKTLTFSIPIKILDSERANYIDNPRWQLVNKEYKIRTNEDGEINEFVLRNYTENHSSSDELLIDVECCSYAEFDLGQIGYNISFDENSLYQYKDDEDPSDPDNTPIGTYNSDIHFWMDQLLEVIPDWSYEVKSYYPIDTDLGDNDNRQKIDTTSSMKTGPEQFYEDDRIIGYDNSNNPVYSERYTIKERIITISKSNIWNIIQELCEKFECWPKFVITYENNKVAKKTILLRNDVEEEAQFSIHYKKNLQSIQRIVDTSQIVTKMYVSDISNENVDDGIVSISTNDKNFMKENYLLDLSWYLGEDRSADTEVSNLPLIDLELSTTFKASNYATPALAENIIEKDTKKIINDYQSNIRARNVYIDDKSTELSKAKEDLINYNTDYETYVAARDSALEQYNTVVDEWKLCPTGAQIKTNRRCYLYEEDGNMIVKFSEKGIKEEDFPQGRDLYSPINLVFTESNEKVTNDNIYLLSWEPIEWDEIIGTVTKARVNNVTIGAEENSGCFSCDLVYYPLEYYNMLKKYWDSKVQEFKNKLQKLGKPSSEGGTSGIIVETERLVAQLKLDLYNAQKEKQQVITQFETLLRPYIREGYWEDTDYGIYTNKAFTLTPLMAHEEPLYNEVLGKINWSQDYICYLIPNLPIITYKRTYEEITYDADGNAQVTTRTEEKQVYLYDVIDISSIEIMTRSPSESSTKGTFKSYVLGTDFEVNFGYTTYDTTNESSYKRGIYVIRYQTANNVGEITPQTQLYFRVKTRGSDDYYIYKGYLSPVYDSKNSIRPYYAQMERKIQIDKEDVILSSIDVEVYGSRVWAGSYRQDEDGLAKSKGVTATNYTLTYGTDYYTAKETENGAIVTNIYLNETTNTPLGTDVALTDTSIWYAVTLNQDITSKYYYNDAQEVMSESSIPQVSYSIDVLDIKDVLNPNLNVENFKPVVGTRIPIYDKELGFYGLTGFINTIERDLLDGKNTSITITNYKDKFEDLFQKITAAAVSLQSKEYEYDRTTTIVDTSTGAISMDLLENALWQANTAISMSENNDVTWDSSGITVTNKDLNSNGVYGKLKITSNGIFIANKYSEFGDYAWTTAITPDFINANAITVGNLDTKQIQIYNSSEPNFIWNEKGIFAYGENSNGSVDYNTYVLYNKDGLRFRQLASYQHNMLLDNLFKDKLTTDFTNWTVNGDSYNVENITYNSLVTPIIKISGSPLYNELSMLTKTDRLLKYSGTAGLVKNHKYYYRFIMKYDNIPASSELTFYYGFTGNYIEVPFEDLKNKNTDGTSSTWALYSGFLDYITPIESFGAFGTLNQYADDWSISIGTPMIIDMTEVFGDSFPTTDSIDSVEYFTGITTITPTDFNIYQDSVVLGWNGLSIGAQNGIVQLTSTDGLVVYAPTSTDNYYNKQIRLQLGTWTDDDGTEKYGLRCLKNGQRVAEISQDGAVFSYNNDQDYGSIDKIIDASLSYTCYINSSNGSTFTNGYIDTILEAVVMKGTTIVTDLLAEGNFVWSKILKNGTQDTSWTPNYVTGSNHSKIQVTEKDVSEKATFVCDIIIDET